MAEKKELIKDIDDNSPLFSIGVVADLLQISVPTVRLYEAEGLIIPFKKGSKHRLYSQNDIQRLKCIREAITNKGYSIAGIKALYSMIPCWSIKDCSIEERNDCQAFKEFSNPCWSYKHKDNICELQNCVFCEVYSSHYQCISIKETIKQKTSQK